MRKAIFLILFLNLFSAKTQTIQVDFEVEGFKDSIAYIGYHFGSQKYILDTLKVTENTFTLELESEEVKPGLYFIYTPEFFLEFVLENNSYTIEATYGKGYDEFESSGSIENKLFKSFQIELGALQREQVALQNKLNTANKVDSVNIAQRISQIAMEMDTFRDEMKQAYPDAFTVAFLELMERVDVPSFDAIQDPARRSSIQYQYYKNHYFDQVDLNDPRMLRTPLLHSKVINYFDQLVIQDPDSVNKEIDWFFNEVKEPELFRYWLVTLFNKYAEAKVMGMDGVMTHMIESYYLTPRADWLADDYEKKLREELAYVKPNLLGKLAPPIDVVDSLMQPVYLAEIEAPYTLVFIYDPDCGHCKKAIEELETHDSELANLGVQVFAVCTTTDIERWKAFVNGSNPMWTHAIDPTGKSYFRVTYNVRSTPKIYLLNQNKEIVAKQLDIAQIVDFVKRQAN